jgi:hypothetical protein
MQSSTAGLLLISYVPRAAAVFGTASQNAFCLFLFPWRFVECFVDNSYFISILSVEKKI